MSNDNSSITVLVVEDNLLNQKVAKILLEDAGFIVDIAVNGAEGIRMFSEKTYSVVLLDIGMPDISGLDVCKEIKKINKDIHVIAYTANGEYFMKQCVEAGFDDIIIKPVLQHELTSIIRKHI